MSFHIQNTLTHDRNHQNQQVINLNEIKKQHEPEYNDSKWHLEKGSIQFLISSKVKYASPEQDHQHFVPVLTSLRLKTAGIWSRSQLSTGYTAAGPEFNLTEIKKGPSRASPGGIFKGI